MTKLVAGAAAVAVCLLLTAGCATREKRIAQNAAMFSSLPAEVRANIRAGRVEPGYTRDMVYLALGRPDRIYNRKTAGKTTEIWIYHRDASSYTSEPVFTEARVENRHGRVASVPTVEWVDVQTRTQEPAVRIEFDGDKAVSVETPAPP